MTDLVRARPAKGKKREFLIDRRLAERYPDHYTVIDPDPPTPKNEADVELTD